MLWYQNFEQYYAFCHTHGCFHNSDHTGFPIAVVIKGVTVGNDQEKTQSEREDLSKNRGGKKLNYELGTYTLKTYRKEVQVGKDQGKTQSEKDSHSKNTGGKKLN